jgi:hypothetical protein
MERKNHGDPPNRNLVLGRQTNLLPYSHNLEAELGLLIAGAGVSLANLKAMDAGERSTHAAKCSADRSIGAKTLASLAEKMGCDADQNTKLKRLEWVFNTYI